MFMCVKLASKGYYGGNPELILNAPVDVVFKLLEFENFELDYASEYRELNDKNK